VSTSCDVPSHSTVPLRIHSVRRHLPLYCILSSTLCDVTSSHYAVLVLPPSGVVVSCDVTSHSTVLTFTLCVDTPVLALPDPVWLFCVTSPPTTLSWPSLPPRCGRWPSLPRCGPWPSLPRCYSVALPRPVWSVGPRTRRILRVVLINITLQRISRVYFTLLTAVMS